jgi:hypothetical protein
MKNFLKNNWHTLLITAFALLIVLINSDPSSVIMGIDNASPYFYPNFSLSRIKGASTFINPGLVFAAPIFSILRNISISPEILSNLYILGMFPIGIISTAKLTEKIGHHINKTNPKIITVLAALIYGCSLLTLWIFGHPNFMFIAAYGAIPAVLYSLATFDNSLKSWILIILSSWLFLFTSQNVIAFTLFILQILILASLSRSQIQEKTPKKAFIKTVIWATAIILIWLSTLQIIAFTNNDQTFVIGNLVKYTQQLQENNLMPQVKNDLIAAERESSLLNSARFALGWMELHTTKGKPVFEYYDTYKNNFLFILIGIIPTLAGILFTVKHKPESKKELHFVYIMGFLMIIGVFLNSRYFLDLIKSIPKVSDALRWSSSKFWPIYYIPLTILGSLGLSHLINSLKNALLQNTTLIAIILIFFLYAFPVLTGNLISSQVKVDLPKEYLKIKNTTHPDDSILNIPAPQGLYFREYKWGYFGSDFLSFVTKADIIDAANVFENPNEYEKFIDQLESCQITGEIDKIIYDKSLVEIEDTNFNYDRIEECLNKDFDKIEENDYFVIYKTPVNEKE